jgi:hypothetical protein
MTTEPQLRSVATVFEVCRDTRADLVPSARSLANQQNAGPGQHLDPDSAWCRPPVRAAIPDTKLVVITGAGHVSTLERPEPFNDADREFSRAQSPRSV